MLTLGEWQGMAKVRVQNGSRAQKPACAGCLMAEMEQDQHSECLDY